MTVQQSLVDALLLSAAAAASKHNRSTARGSDSTRATVAESDGGSYSCGQLSKGGDTGTRRSSYPLKPRHVVDLSGLASPSSSSPLLFLKSSNERGRRKERTSGRNDKESMKRAGSSGTPLESHFSSNSSTGSVTVSTAALTVDSSAVELSPPKSIRCHHHRGRGGGARKEVRFALDANETIKSQVFEYTDGPSCPEEFDRCYMTRRETKLNKRRAGHFARQFALRYPERAQIVEQLFASPLRCEGGGTADGVGKSNSPPCVSSSLSNGILPPKCTSSMDEPVQCVEKTAASRRAGCYKADSSDASKDAVPTTEHLQRRLIGGDDHHSEARGLEPFMVPLIRRHQLWSIRATLGRHRHLVQTRQRSTSTHVRDIKSATPSYRFTQAGAEDEDDDEALRRCCEAFNACTRDLARLMAEADAAAAQRIYHQS